MSEQRMIGHRHDHNFEELNEALFQATLNGDEAQIMQLQNQMRTRFGDLL